MSIPLLQYIKMVEALQNGEGGLFTCRVCGRVSCLQTRGQFVGWWLFHKKTEGARLDPQHTTLKLTASTHPTALHRPFPLRCLRCVLWHDW